MTIFQKYQSGLGNSTAYQLSGIPFLSSSIAVSNETLRIDFPKVTKFFSVRNETPTASSNSPLRVGFDDLSTQYGTQYVELANKESIYVDSRVAYLYLYSESASSASINAGLTPIDSNVLQFNWSGSLGITAPSGGLNFSSFTPPGIQAYFLDGGDEDLRTLGTSMQTMLAGSTSYIASMWYKPSSLGSARSVLVSWVPSQNRSTFSISTGPNGEVEGRASDALTEQNATTPRYEVLASSGSAVIGEWMHYAVYVDATDVRLFLNGFSVGTPITNKNNYVVSSSQLLFGGDAIVNGVYQGAVTTHIHGHVRDMAIITDMPHTNINELIQTLPGNILAPADLTSSISVGTLQGWWKAGPGDTSPGLLDSSGNGRDGGTLNNPIIDDDGAIEWDV